MPRSPRILTAGAVYHVTARGTPELLLFADDHERAWFAAELDLTARRAKWVILEYVLLSTHYHMLVKTLEPTLHSGLQWLHGRYGRRCNDRRHRFGPVFAGRYKARLIHDEAYLQAAVVYVRWNAVRAGLVDTPAEWPWRGGTLVAADEGVRPLDMARRDRSCAAAQTRSRAPSGS